MITRIITVMLLNILIKCVALYCAYVVLGGYVVVAWFFVQWIINWLTAVDAAELFIKEINDEP
jgi:hypothetical protein